MVYEFPELQGIMGREYARLEGETPRVVQAIFEHYLPVEAGGALPQDNVGAFVSIADKIDTICGCFGVGLIPTGSADPYALRRSAIGILNILLSAATGLSVPELVEQSLELLAAKADPAARPGAGRGGRVHPPAPGEYADPARILRRCGRSGAGRALRRSRSMPWPGSRRWPPSRPRPVSSRWPSLSSGSATSSRAGWIPRCARNCSRPTANGAWPMPWRSARTAVRPGRGRRRLRRGAAGDRRPARPGRRLLRRGHGHGRDSPIYGPTAWPCSPQVGRLFDGIADFAKISRLDESKRLFYLN